jgi:O-antigen/teichoic acid export membrane protein
MANTVLTVLVIVAGAAADLGAVNFLARVRPLRRKDRIRKAVRLVWVLGLLVALLAVVPFAGYYLCAFLTVPDDGYAAGWLLFLVGFIVFVGSANWLAHRHDLKRLEAEDDTSAGASGGTGP